MTDDQTTAPDDPGSAVPEAYVPPAIEVLGSVEDLTRGPLPGPGDVPTGVISF
jgi:hypothetical protein